MPRKTYSEEDLLAVRKVAETYKQLLHDASVSSIVAEYKLWVAKWKREVLGGVKIPNNLLQTVDLCDTDLYPSINVCLRILATLPVSAATAERTFSTFRRLKTWLRATMGVERLTGLALFHIHRDIKVDVEAVITRFAKSSRKLIEFVL